MPYRSHTWAVEVRDEIAREFTRSDGVVDDALAGLHEIRRRLLETGNDLATGEKPSAGKPPSKDG